MFIFVRYKNIDYMKKFLSLVALSILLASCSGSGNSKITNEYGPVKVDTTKAINVQAFFDDFEQVDGSKEYTIVGKIIDKCKMSGCWVEIDGGNDDSFIVNFKDEFAIPLDTKNGITAYMHGVAMWDSTSVEQLKEEAFDDGKTQTEIDAITDPKYTFSFEADGIYLKK